MGVSGRVRVQIHIRLIPEFVFLIMPKHYVMHVKEKQTLILAKIFKMNSKNILNVKACISIY